MADYAMMPIADYEDACDAVREKNGETALIKSGELGDKIRGIKTGVTVQKKTGTVRTNSSGIASVTNLGFKPDVVAFDGGVDPFAGYSYSGAMLTEAGKTELNVVISPPNSNYLLTYLMVTPNSNGFSVTAYKVSTSDYPSSDTYRSINYVAIKYTE